MATLTYNIVARWSLPECRIRRAQCETELACLVILLSSDIQLDVERTHAPAVSMSLASLSAMPRFIAAHCR